MAYLGNGQYEIINDNTGETKVVTEQELSQYGIKPDVAERSFEKTGLYDIPVLGGLTRAIIEPGEKFGRMLEGGKYELGRRFGITSGENPYLTSQELEKYSTPQSAALEVGKRTLGALSYAVPGAGFVKSGLAPITDKGAAIAGGMLGFSESKGGPIESLTSAAITAPISAVAGPVFSKVTRALTSIPGATMRGITERLPENVRKSADLQESKVVDLVRKKLGTMVGTENVDKGINLGINENTDLNSAKGILEAEKDRLGMVLNSFRSGKYLNLKDVENKLYLLRKNSPKEVQGYIDDFIKNIENIDVNISRSKTEQLFEKGKLKLDQAPIGPVTEPRPVGPGPQTTVLEKTGTPVKVKGKQVLNAAGEPMMQPEPIAPSNIKTNMNVQPGQEVSTGLPKTVAQKPNIVLGPGPDEKPNISLDALEQFRQDVSGAFEDSKSLLNNFRGDRALKELKEKVTEMVTSESSKGDEATKKLIQETYHEYGITRTMLNNVKDQLRATPASPNITDFLTKKQALEQAPLTGAGTDVIAAATALGGASLFGPLGLLPSGAYWIYRIMQGVMKNPTQARKIANFLSNKAIDPNTFLSKLGGMGKEGVIKTLEQIGIRGAAKLVK